MFAGFDHGLRARHRCVAAALTALLLAAPTARASPAAPASADALGDWLAGREGGANLVLAALNFVGVAYRQGGSHFSDGFDCSGFTRHVYALGLGLALPRQAHEQANAGGLLAVEREALLPGDLVFFDTQQQAHSHVGIYVGGGRFVHAPRSGSEVRLEDMGMTYWRQRFTGARRALAGAQ